MKTHYAGEIIWENGSVLPGWAACCSGDRAVEIRERGNHTLNKVEVTCKQCLKMIARHEVFAPTYAALKERRDGR